MHELDVGSDPELRAAVASRAGTPTLPQLFVRGTDVSLSADPEVWMEGMEGRRSLSVLLASWKKIECVECIRDTLFRSLRSNSESYFGAFAQFFG